MSNALTQTPESARNLKGRAVVAPPVDIYENADNYLIITDLPGVAEGDVQIRLDRGELLIEGNRGAEAPAGTLLGRECRPHDFRRTFVVPDDIQADAVSAELRKGVLRVVLPKAAAARPRRIEVKSQPN